LKSWKSDREQLTQSVSSEMLGCRLGELGNMSKRPSQCPRVHGDIHCPIHAVHSFSNLTAALLSMKPKSTLCPSSSRILLTPYLIIVGLSKLRPNP
jgi:hypothetical protein